MRVLRVAQASGAYRRLQLQCACPPLAALIVGVFFCSQKKHMQVPPRVQYPVDPPLLVLNRSTRRC